MFDSSTSKKPDSKAASPGKGKGKQEPVDTPKEENVDEEDDDDDDDDEGEGEEEEEDEEDEETFEEIDPTAIRSRRTRGVKVDYTSPEALAKAGLTGNEKDDEDEDVEME
ncbi:hypothetical protein EDC04DRAFT_3016085 [Pisolithus marmoratus]|nr:hypothetical protein EDC04DRAFT_3016085 [Pisolithus marmoratus]